jgi:glycine/D-amino acid oxidase-like deaminating enzyme
MTHAPTTYPSLAFNIRVDAVVMGGGLTGVTAAYLIKKAGCTVALVDPRRCGEAEMHRPSVHATAVPRAGMAALVDRIGPESAKAVWEAGFAAVARIRANVRDERINCQFGWVSACRYASPAVEPAVARAALWREATIAASLGIEAIELDTVRGLALPGLLFEGQARFQPLSYLGVLVSRIPGAGSYVFEDTTIDTVDGPRPFVIRCGEYRITADHLVVATPLPAVHVRGLHLAPLTSRIRQVQRAVVGATADRNDLADGLYWEHGADGGESLTVDRSQQTLRVGVEGVLRDAGGREAIAGLARRLCERVPGARLTHQWSGPAEESVDGLPCIGAVAPRQFVAAGLGDNDIAFGTLAGMMAADAVSGRVNPWRERLGFDRDRVAGEVPLRTASSA